MIKITKKEKLPIRDEVDKELLELVSESAYEMRKEDDLYLVGPFWIIGKSVEEINKGNFYDGFSWLSRSGSPCY